MDVNDWLVVGLFYYSFVCINVKLVVWVFGFEIVNWCVLMMFVLLWFSVIFNWWIFY